MAYNYSAIYPFIAYSVAIGVLLGVVYDIFRIIRMACSLKAKGKRSGFFVNCVFFICDVAFFLIAAVISAIFIFYANNGRIRGIAIFGSLVGFIAYYNSIGRLVNAASGAIIRGICYVIDFILHRIISPCFVTAARIIKGLTDHVYTKRHTRRIIKGFKKKGC